MTLNEVENNNGENSSENSSDVGSTQPYQEAEVQANAETQADTVIHADTVIQADTAIQTEDQTDTETQSGAKFDLHDIPRTSALEVTVDHSIEKAMKILKRKLIKEGLFKELKMRRYFEKPCERRKRKQKESLKKARKEASRLRKNPFM